MRFRSVPGSSPEAGSSRNIRFGSDSSSTAMLALLRWPPLRERIRLFLFSVSSTSSIAREIAASRSWGVVSFGRRSFEVYISMS